MPEITSIKAVQDKLREFDERMDEAIAAAKSLARIRADAEKLNQDVGNVSQRAEQEIERMRGVRQSLSKLQIEWGSLKQEVHKALDQSKDARQKWQMEHAVAIQSIDSKLLQAGERIIALNETKLFDQEQLLKHLDADTRENAALAINAKDVTAKLAGESQRLLESVRNELQRKVQNELQQAEQSLDSKINAHRADLDGIVESALETIETRVVTSETAIQLETSAFRDEVNISLAKQKVSSESQLTDFLNKQNALVQNLTQQIDSYQRVAAAVAADFSQVRSEFEALSTAQRAERAVMGREIGLMRAELTTLRGDFNKESQEEENARRIVEATVKVIEERLGETLKKLAGIPMVGKQFK
jgi:hypothetical protein